MEPPRIIPIPGDDPEMLAAMKQARDTFPEFWKMVADARRLNLRALETALVKAYFHDPGSPEGGEHMWVRDLSFDGKLIRGTLSSRPEHVRSVQAGQAVSFPIERLSDWLAVVTGQAEGAFTVKVLRSRMTPAERQAHDSHYPFQFDASSERPPANAAPR